MKTAVILDSYLIRNLFEDAASDVLFQKLINETNWKSLLHRGGPIPRLISIQADLTAYGDTPVYRHPTDYFRNAEPFNDTVLRYTIIEYMIYHIYPQHVLGIWLSIGA